MQYAVANETRKADLQKEISALNEKEQNLRTEGKAIIKQANDSVETNDKDYRVCQSMANYADK